MEAANHPPLSTLPLARSQGACERTRMLKGSTIVFDLDGTLVDTAADLTNALNHVLTRRGHAAVPAATVRSAVGHGIRVMIEETLRRLGTCDDVDELVAEFLVHYKANIARQSRPFPGSVPALERLTNQGARLAVCTNKRESLSRLLLQELDLERYFSAIAGRDTFAVAKPDPGHLTGVIDLAGGDVTRALMVGDSDIDVQTAKAARVPIILVSFGYGPTPRGTVEPEATIDHFDQLEVCAATLLGTKMTRHARS
jgi:phosphoglycolate phosphatase